MRDPELVMGHPRAPHIRCVTMSQIVTDADGPWAPLASVTNGQLQGRPPLDPARAMILAPVGERGPGMVPHIWFTPGKNFDH